MKLLFLKRPFDFLLSLAGILISLPLWLLIGIMIFIEDGFPIFYSQERIGKNRKIFKVLKFRSMVKDAEKQGIWTNENDPRVSKVGRFLRKTAMDELPSLLTILKGDMSFVGPKALVVEEQCLLEKKITGFEKRLEVKPRLTGLSQVLNPEDDPYRKLEYDLEYMREMSFWLDIKLILLSFYNTFMFRWDRRSGKKMQE
uniref:Sugar transferase n=1 Tax=candidate division WOR-3 bacterium TaxID=2052148 RepID=A0A7V3VTN7_UNCW3